jgi:chemotaxis signal transduction protein
VALHLGGEIYGVDIACIHTVIMPQAITGVPRAPRSSRA